MSEDYEVGVRICEAILQSFDVDIVDRVEEGAYEGLYGLRVCGFVGKLGHLRVASWRWEKVEVGLLGEDELEKVM